LGISVFITTMKYHVNSINKFTETIKNMTDSDIETSNKIQLIVNGYYSLRNGYSQTIKKINFFFVSTNTVGLISTYFTFLSIQDKVFMINNIINLVTFFIIAIIYINYAQKVNRAVETTYEEIISPNYTNKYITHSNDVRIEIEPGNSNNVLTKILVENIRISRVQDWIIMKNTFEVKWDQFTFLGFPINDVSIFQKILAIIFTFAFAKDMASLVNFTGGS
jgi:hypothetical protein